MNLGGVRPNVLLVLADQLSAHMLRCAGNEHTSTPHLDALATGGARFDRAYVTFPLCVPSRVSMMTGQVPHTLGVYSNQPAAPPSALRGPDSLASVMARQGYRCAYAGKWHAVQPSVEEADGFEVVKDFGDEGLVEAVAAHLADTRDDPRPFFLVASFDDPHTICELARNQPSYYGLMASPAGELPNLPPSFGRQPFEPEALRAEQRSDAFMYGTGTFTPDDWRVYRRQYADLVERTDNNIGRLLGTLDDLGLTEETLVVASSDHGDGDAAHAWNQKTALFEEIVRVPLILRWPGTIPPGVRTSSLASIGLDLLPTLCDAAGATPPASAPGSSLLPVAHGEELAREHLVVETGFGSGARPRTSGRALIGERFKYVVYSWGKHREQLFDLFADPHELVNLAVETRFEGVLERCRRSLLEWCLATEDELMLNRLVLPSDVSEDLRRQIYALPY